MDKDPLIFGESSCEGEEFEEPFLALVCLVEFSRETRVLWDFCNKMSVFCMIWAFKEDMFNRIELFASLAIIRDPLLFNGFGKEATIVLPWVGMSCYDLNVSSKDFSWESWELKELGGFGAWGFPNPLFCISIPTLYLTAFFTLYHLKVTWTSLTASWVTSDFKSISSTAKVVLKYA